MTKMQTKANFKNLSAREYATRLLEIKNPLVIPHVRPDGDAVGTAAALCLIFQSLGICAKILSQDKIPDRLKFILDYTGVEISSESEGYAALTVDVASPSQLGSLYNEEKLPALMLDHHKVGEQFADYYIIPEASSAGEVLFDIVEVLEDMGKIQLDKKLAFALYCAISSDTGRFAYSNTTAKTHRCVSRLIECGIDTSDINRRLFETKSKEQIKAEGFVASRIMSDFDGRVTYATLTLQDKKRLGLEDEHFETAIDIVRSLRGARVSFFAREIERNKYKLSLRSIELDVAKIASRFGGGGHTRAAGCTVEAPGIKALIRIVLDELSTVKDQI